MSSCRFCTREFVKNGNRVFCSDRCYDGAKRVSAKVKEQKKAYQQLTVGVACPTCGEKVYQLKVRKYCNKCRDKEVKAKAKKTAEKKDYLRAREDKEFGKKFNAEKYKKAKARKIARAGGKPVEVLNINPYFLKRGNPSGAMLSGYLPSA